MTRIVVALALVCACATAAAQQRAPRVGWLSFAASPTQFPEKHALDGLRELGWIDGKNVQIVFRHAAGDARRLDSSAAELVQMKPDLVVTFSAGVPVAKKTISTIPVVFGTSQDPVRTGYVASLARPGSNFTGVTYLTDELSAKRLELVKDMLRGASRISIVWERTHIDNEFNGMQAAAPGFGMRVHSIDVQRPARPDEVELAVQAAVNARADAIVLAPGGFTISNRKAIIAAAAKHRIPVVSAWSVFADDGALFTYGPHLQEISRRIASHIDKVLKGAKPESLPVETPAKFELVINQQAAKALGVSVPQQVLQRADRIIQ